MDSVERILVREKYTLILVMFSSRLERATGAEHWLKHEGNKSTNSLET